MNSSWLLEKTAGNEGELGLLWLWMIPSSWWLTALTVYPHYQSAWTHANLMAKEKRELDKSWNTCWNFCLNVYLISHVSDIVKPHNGVLYFSHRVVLYHSSRQGCITILQETGEQRMGYTHTIYHWGKATKSDKTIAIKSLMLCRTYDITELRWHLINKQVKRTGFDF